MADALQSQSPIPVPAPKMQQFMHPSSEVQPAVFQQLNANAARLPEGLCFAFLSPK